MNVAALRHQIDRWLDRLSPEHLALVASFIEFLSQKQRQGVIISQNNLPEVFSAEIQEMPPANSFSIPEPSEIDGEGQSKAALLQDFRQAWHEAMTGQTISVAQMWEGIENDWLALNSSYSFTNLQSQFTHSCKKYRSIRNDIQPIIEQLTRGELPGDRIAGVGYAVFKLRVRNSDTQKGKSGGYRLIYYVQTATGIILLTLYTKSEQVDIAAEDIQNIITEYEQQQSEDREDI